MLNKCFVFVPAFLLILLSCTNMHNNEPVRIVFDTDFGGDADDLGALAMLDNFSANAPWMIKFYHEGEITPNSTYDQTSVLYAVRGGVGKYWEEIENGICEADDTGGNYWKKVDDEDTNHAYLVLRKTPEEMVDIIYSFMLDTF